MYKTSLKLTDEEKEIMEGNRGEVLQKIMESVVKYGEVFEATELIEINSPIHVVTSFGIPLLKPLFSIMDNLIENDLKTKHPFTVDPRPLDYDNVKCNLLEKMVFKIMYGKQDEYESQLKKVGLVNDNAYSCTSYLDENDNKPNYGQMLAWAESSAVVYVNSVLGARSNRNSGIIELFCGILGKAPLFGFLEDEGRKADWIIEVKTSKLPQAQLLGSAIGIKVMDQVPYIYGLDKYLGNELNNEVKDYLKDMGAASASNGAVGLYHVNNLTPEAVNLSDELIKEDAKIYIIDDEELEKIKNSYPVMWKSTDLKPKLAFIGCPHCSYNQLIDWTNKMYDRLNGEKLKVRTIFTSSPNVIEKFKNNHEVYKKFLDTGANISYICPLMYTNNVIANKKPIITNSNKLRTYSNARYFDDNEILEIIVKGEI